MGSNIILKYLLGLRCLNVFVPENYNLLLSQLRNDENSCLFYYYFELDLNSIPRTNIFSQTRPNIHNKYTYRIKLIK